MSNLPTVINPEVEIINVWTVTSAGEAYASVKQLEGWVLAKAKADLVFGEFGEFCKSIGKSETSVNKKIAYFKAQLSFRTESAGFGLEDNTKVESVSNRFILPTMEEAEIIVADKSNPVAKISESSYRELKGDTPAEKVQSYEDIKVATGKVRPTRKDVRESNTVAEDPDELFIAKYGCTFKESRNVDIVKVMVSTDISLADPLGDYPDFKKHFRDLLKVAHPDRQGGNTELTAFVNYLYAPFKELNKVLPAYQEAQTLYDEQYRFYIAKGGK